MENSKENLHALSINILKFNINDRLNNKLNIKLNIKFNIKVYTNLKLSGINFLINRNEAIKLKHNEHNSNENEKSIIDEIINSLGKDVNLNDCDDDFLTTNEKNNKKVEYEIVMNCDDSEYIIYYKKSK